MLGRSVHAVFRKVRLDDFELLSVRMVLHGVDHDEKCASRKPLAQDFKPLGVATCAAGRTIRWIPPTRS